MTNKDALGTRMKDQYEDRVRYKLPRRTHTIIRLDGKAFHTYTKGLDRPYDVQFMLDMIEVVIFLAENIEGTRFAYAQSDEVSLLLTDYTTVQTNAWFDGNIQKIASISASLATARFNELRPGKLALFDSRVFTIPDLVEVHNYFVWRQMDAIRNSVSMAAQAYFSPKQLLGLSSNQMQELLWAKTGNNWNDYDPRFRRGSVVVPTVYKDSIPYVDKRSGETRVAENVQRRVWLPSAAPIFTREPKFITELIPSSNVQI